MSSAGATWWSDFRSTPLRDLLRAHVSGRYSVGRLVASAELPEPIAALVQEVTVRTSLWRREQAEVAEELVRIGRQASRSSVQWPELRNTLPGLTGGRIADNLAWLTFPSRAEFTAEFDRWMSMHEGAVDTPPWRRTPQRSDFAPATRALRSVGHPFWPLAMIAPDVVALVWTSDELALDLDVTIVAACLRSARDESGRWPTALTAIVPRILPAIPADPVPDC